MLPLENRASTLNFLCKQEKEKKKGAAERERGHEIKGDVVGEQVNLL